MTKKIISIALSLVLTLSLASAAIVGASAATDSNGRYVPSTDDTNRYYFYLPNEWKNEAWTGECGVYWWGGTDACSAVDGSNPDAPAWPGHMAKKEADYETGSVYYVDCPTDVTTVNWNNYVNGGEDKEAAIYKLALQTDNIGTEYYDPDESETYPDGLDSFDNMIYVLDPSKKVENALNGKVNQLGEYFFYYGNGEYGTYATREEAEAAGEVYNLAWYPDLPSTEDEADEPTTTAPVTDTDDDNKGGTTSTVPTSSQDATSAVGSGANASTSDTATSTVSGGAIQTGDASLAVVVLLVVAASAGVVVFTRKRMI